jgi:hypothetical protein
MGVQSEVNKETRTMGWNELMGVQSEVIKRETRTMRAKCVSSENDSRSLAWVES